LPTKAREDRKAAFKKELADLLDLVIPKGAISICLIADKDKGCRLSTIPSPEEFTVKVADIQNRGFDVVVDEAWEKSIAKVEDG
jgi:hypothetical protein